MISGLDVVIIAKDEKRFISGAVRNAKAISKRVIVCDTGSTDGTIRLAREAGADVVRFSWCDDFAVARNFAISQSTAPYVLIQDADMRFVVSNEYDVRKPIKAAMDRGSHSGAMRIHDASVVDASARDVIDGKARLGDPWIACLLFRRELGGSIYTGAIHETAEAWIDAQKAAGHGLTGLLHDAHVIHLGAIAEVRAGAGKANRNAKLLLSRIASNPGDGVAYSYLIHEYLAAGQSADMAKLSEAGWPVVLADPKTVNIHLVRFACGRLWIQAQAQYWRGMLDTIRKVRETYAHPDLCTFAAIAYHHTGLHDKAKAEAAEGSRLIDEGLFTQTFTQPRLIAQAIAKKRSVAPILLAGV